jgi:uncharacterized membrane protein
MAFCPNCGNQIPVGASACPVCAGTAQTVPPAASYSAPNASAQTQVGGLTENVAGALAYVTLIPPVLFLLLEPYNKNRFVRFHSFQCLFLCVAFIVLGFGLAIIGMIPVIGLITLPLHLVIWLGAFVLWIILVMKAFQGQKFKLPVIGDLAEQQANTV